MSWIATSFGKGMTIILVSILLVDIYRYKLFSLNRPYAKDQLNKHHQSPQTHLENKRITSLTLIFSSIILFIYVLSYSVL